MRGTVISLVALIIWVPICISLFLFIFPRRAVLVAYIAGWLFLPMRAGFQITGLPDIDKTTITSSSILLGILIFDNARLFSFRLRWFDLPMIVWCFSPLISSMTNGLGIYDGLSAALVQVFRWGLPYYIGRIYFNDRQSLRELALSIFIGGLIYVPFCLYEIRFSPQLHRMVYGFHQHSFVQTMRFGGFRPMVFMQHGLMVGMWMMASFLIGTWLWMSGSVKKLWGVRVGVLLIVLLVTTVLCKSIGALMLLVLGLGTLFAVRHFRSTWFLLPVLLIAPIYIAARLTGLSTGELAVSTVEVIVNKERANSLAFRLANEDLLTERAMERPLFGWGGWGRSRVFDAYGNDITTTDGYWVIALGQKGLIGVAGLTLSILCPVILFSRRYHVRLWSHPVVAPSAVLSILLCLYMIDCLMNAMLNPLFILVMGGLTGVAGFSTVRIVKKTAPAKLETAQMM